LQRQISLICGLARELYSIGPCHTRPAREKPVALREHPSHKENCSERRLPVHGVGRQSVSLAGASDGSLLDRGPAQISPCLPTPAPSGIGLLLSDFFEYTSLTECYLEIDDYDSPICEGNRAVAGHHFLGAQPIFVGSQYPGVYKKSSARSSEAIRLYA